MSYNLSCSPACSSYWDEALFMSHVVLFPGPCNFALDPVNMTLDSCHSIWSPLLSVKYWFTSCDCVCCIPYHSLLRRWFVHFHYIWRLGFGSRSFVFCYALVSFRHFLSIVLVCVTGASRRFQPLLKAEVSLNDVTVVFDQRSHVLTPLCYGTCFFSPHIQWGHLAVQLYLQYLMLYSTDWSFLWD